VLVAEVVAYVAAFAGYVWFVMPAGAQGAATDGAPPEPLAWLRVACAAMLVLAPMGLNLLHGDRPADSGLRLDNFKASARLVVPATLVMAVVVAAVAFALHGWEWISFKRFAERSGGYLVWGMVQQYLLQAFALRRLRQAKLSPAPAVIVAACLFAMLHAPNWWLVGSTCLGAIVWCGIFIRVPNLLTLGLAHAVMGVLMYHAWYVPARALTIGPAFWRGH
jgi:hypothetical protein